MFIIMLIYQSPRKKDAEFINNNEINKICLGELEHFGDGFLIASGYIKDADGSWIDDNGNYPTSKIEQKLEEEETKRYNICINKPII